MENPQKPNFKQKYGVKHTTKWCCLRVYLKRERVWTQCHLDKNNEKNSVCRNMYPVLFL